MVKASGSEKMFKHYMKAPDFELDHHRDLRYPTVEPHYHEFYELLYFISGHVDYIVGDKIYHLQNDDLLLIPPNAMHNPVFHDFDVPYERFVLWVSIPTLRRLLAVDAELELPPEQAFPQSGRYLLRRPTAAWGSFRSIFSSLEETLSQQKALYRAQVKSFILHLLIEYRKAQLDGSLEAVSGVRDNLLLDILHYIQTHLAEDLSLDTISAAFLMDKFNLSHLFKEKMSISYYQYVIQQRLLLGKNQLLAGIPANKVCYSCGFHDYSSFFRAFKKEYEVSPAQFKKLHEDITR